MKNNDTLDTDRMRILGSFFWVAGAITMLLVAYRSYDHDLSENS